MPNPSQHFHSGRWLQAMSTPPTRTRCRAYPHLLTTMYFDWRLFGMTRGVRGRVVLAAVIGLAAIPVSMLRLTLTGQAMARAFSGEPFDALIGMLVLIAGLILVRAVLQ